ncbi:hypothetical protein NSS71_25320 [Niallia sp. FSL W8-0951]|uniref:hypothetical protein n=1 Tax=Niallia sp. FSL W8-0951 TaxID=2954639 RepID=UPI0030F6265F
MDFIACSLKNFKVLGYNNPIKLKCETGKIFNIIYREKVLRAIVESYNYQLRFGTEISNTLCNNYALVSVIENSIGDKNKRSVIINNEYVLAQNFSTALWFIKDNAVTPYFVTISSNGAFLEPSILKRNVYYSDSKAKFDLVDFSKEELNEAIKWFDILLKFMTKIETNKINVSASTLENMSAYLTFDIPSFERAFHFLDIARKNDFLPAKIASYISILESLFAVKGENTHKVAERAAALIAKDKDERYDLFRDIVSFYGIRSDYIHGSEIKSKTHDVLPQTSKKLDSIVRRVLIEMYLNHPELNYRNKKSEKTKSFDEVNEWFIRLTFS